MYCQVAFALEQPQRLVAEDHGERQPSVLFAKMRQDPGQQQMAHEVVGRDADMSGQLALLEGELVGKLVVSRHDRARALLEYPPGLGQDERAGRPADQLGIEDGFQLDQPAAGDRRRDVARPRASGDAAAVGDGEEEPQQVDVRHYNPLVRAVDAANGRPRSRAAQRPARWLLLIHRKV